MKQPTNNKVLTYSTLAIGAVIVVAIFLTAKSYAQLAIAVLLYPLIAFFAFKAFPRKTWDAPVIEINMPVKRVEKTEPGSHAKVEVADIDRRTFLKLIGAAGLSFFVFSLLGRRVESLLFGRSNSEINSNEAFPSQTSTTSASPTEGYKITEIDNNIISYYGFTNKDGGWLIMREETETSSFRYAKGNSGFADSWAKRKSLKYDYFYKLF